LLPEAKRVRAELFRFLDLERGHKSLELVWAALLSEIGGEDVSEPIQKVADRIKLPANVCQQVIHIVSDLSKFNNIFQMREATLLRWVRESWFRDLLDLAKAHIKSHEGNLISYEFAHKVYERELLRAEPKKLLTGDDLIELGFVPSREFSRILKVIDDLSLESKLQTKEQAIDYLLKNLL
jgi:hypothetical protein